MKFEPLPDGGIVRKLWVGETDAYRDHLLRLDRDSRNRRFSGAVSDEFIARHAANARRNRHGRAWLFRRRNAARRRRTAADRNGMFTHEAEAAFSIEQAWQSQGVGTVLLERTLLQRAQPRHPTRCAWTASPTIGACSSSRASSTPI